MGKLDTSVKPAYFNEFWWFVNERQKVFVKRFLEKKPEPWTQDPTLQHYFFTNVYRELDRGTLYLVNKVFHVEDFQPKDILFNIFIYRYFNHIPTYEFLDKFDLRLGKWDAEFFAKKLKQFREAGNQVFTSAFTVTGNRFGGFSDKIDNVCWLINWIQSYLMTKEQWRALLYAPDMETAFERVKSMKGFGAFLAYEIVVDINYYHGQWGEDAFVNPGPGAKRGINWIYPDVSGDKNYKKMIGYLWGIQDVHLPEGFPYTDSVPQRLSMRNIEHSLCEYQKYRKRKMGQKRGRARQFTLGKQSTKSYRRLMKGA